VEVDVILLCLLFLIPTWRIASSKGYNGRAFVLAVGIPASIAIVVDVVIEYELERLASLILAAQVGVPLLVLGVAAILPTRPGAPGKEWRTITFPCPDCRASLSFERELEGLARQCPECGEIVTVMDYKSEEGEAP
jgi:hypothetical protein